MESTLRKGIERRTGNVNQEEQAAYEAARVWQSPIREGYNNKATSSFHRPQEGRVVMVSGSVRLALLLASSCSVLYQI